MTVAQVDRLATVNARAAAQVRAKVLAFLAASWGGLGSYRDRDVDRFLTAVLPVVQAGQQRIGHLTDAYLTQRLSIVLGRRIPPLGAVPENPRGVDPATVYRRPFVTTWMALDKGVPFPEAVTQGATRLESIGATDMQLAKTHTARSRFSTVKGITGYRRTLGGSRNCGLCVVASTQRYHKGDLLPIHPGCDCGVEEIHGGSREQIIAPDLLEQAHEAIEQRFGVSDRGARTPDYRHLILVRDHGEIGPVLTLREHRFTGPRDI